MGDTMREPSMEEILSSIRRVIARDEEHRAPNAGASEAEDVLNLTGDTVDDAAVAYDAESTPVAAESSADAVDQTLVSPVSASASRQSLDALAAALASHGPAQPAAGPVSGDVTLNALVEAMLRPMLRDWLDTHLPAIVEKLVAREIARITGGRL